MKKILFLLLILTAIMIIPIAGCSDDDDLEYTEYINPMTNNPVNTIGWLKIKKEEMKQRFVLIDPEFGKGQAIDSEIVVGAYIKLYTYQGKEYYEVRYGDLELKNRLNDGFLSYQSDVFDSQGKLCVSIIGGDVISTQSGYEHLRNFWNIATFKSLLWEYKVKN